MLLYKLNYKEYFIPGPTFGPFGHRAGVIYSRLFKYTQQHNAGFRENNWAPMPLKVGPVLFHMITFLILTRSILLLGVEVG